MVKIIFLEEFGKAFVPKRVTPYLRQYLQKAGIPEVPYKFFGILFYLSAAVAGIVYAFYVYPFLLQFSSLILLVGSAVLWFLLQGFILVIFILLIYFATDLLIFRRTRQMEEKLPDFLQIVSSNLKGGMSFENALFGAIKPSFTVLAVEMSEVSKKVMTGYDISTALHEFSKKYDSPMLSRSIDLLISEIESGGHITDIIDNIVTSLKDTKALKDDISASVVSYTIFLSVIIIFIAPLLFALSFHLLAVVLKFISRLSGVIVPTNSIHFSISETTLDPQLFLNFSVAALVIISLFSSIIVSIVEKGNIRSGLKFIPLFVAGSLLFYVLFMWLLEGTFGNIAL